MEPISRKSKPLMWVIIAAGAIALFVSIDMGPDGFLGGMLQGAGFAVALMGAYFLGMLHGASESEARGEEPQTWLPSRDSGH